jgi:hypothetical protein
LKLNDFDLELVKKDIHICSNKEHYQVRLKPQG